MDWRLHVYFCVMFHIYIIAGKVQTSGLGIQNHFLIIDHFFQ